VREHYVEARSLNLRFNNVVDDLLTVSEMLDMAVRCFHGSIAIRIAAGRDGFLLGLKVPTPFPS